MFMSIFQAMEKQSFGTHKEIKKRKVPSQPSVALYGYGMLLPSHLQHRLMFSRLNKNPRISQTIDQGQKLKWANHSDHSSPCIFRGLWRFANLKASSYPCCWILYHQVFSLYLPMVGWGTMSGLSHFTTQYAYFLQPFLYTYLSCSTQSAPVTIHSPSSQ